jgi:hypothetical protein
VLAALEQDDTFLFGLVSFLLCFVSAYGLNSVVSNPNLPWKLVTNLLWNRLQICSGSRP